MTAGGSSRMYDGRPVADRRAQRREQFLAAAVTVFGESGYQNSSITALCRTAGLARSQFYEHFENREDLLIAVYDRIQTEARQAVTAATDAAATSGDAVGLAQAAVRAYAESIGRDPRVARIAHVEVVGVGERVEQRRMEQRALWMDFLEDQMRQALGPDFVPPGGFHTAVTGYFGALLALVHQWSTGDEQTDLAGITEVLTRFLISLMTP
ncbi:TetR/AcrR family transcriptional regulator [Nocardia sp. NPDC049526]|uniref:TetR/AcrR family transcriptional regulator n=1 Tax=Nocardia sp. NPDC049526 TaxID=3364316 RepID=UPI00379E725E